MSEWKKIDSAPRDGTPVLLQTALGVVEGWFSQGEWESSYEGGREYTGSVWVCLDDTYSVEVEELPDEEGGGFYDGEVTHWMPLPEGPTNE